MPQRCCSRKAERMWGYPGTGHRDFVSSNLDVLEGGLTTRLALLSCAVWTIRAVAILLLCVKW